MHFDVKKTASELKNRLPELPELNEREMAALAAVGAVALCGVIHAIHRRRMYKKVVSKELKKQLAPISKKLDDLQAENNQLRNELARQQDSQKTAPDPSEA